MKIQQIDNTNFKALHIKDEKYNEKQQNAINFIQNSLDERQVSEIENKGYDVFINKSSRNDSNVEVSIKNKHALREIYIGEYGENTSDNNSGLNFDVNHIHGIIDEFENNKKSLINYCKLALGLFATFVAALCIISGIKSCKPNALDTQKTTTELVKIPSKLK